MKSEKEMWDFLVEHRKSLMAMCKKWARGDSQFAEDLYSDEVLRMMPKVYDRWDPTRGPLKNYAFGYFKLHLMKTAAIRLKKRDSISELMDTEVVKQENTVARSEIIDILDTALPSDVRFIVIMVAINGYTYREVAERLGFSAGFICKMYNEGLQALKTNMERLDGNGRSSW